MAITQLDTETTTPDITLIATVLTHTPSASEHTQCQGFLSLSGLDATGGMFELTVSVGGVAIQPDPQIVSFAATATGAVFTAPFPVPANNAVLLRIKSPNAGDSAGVTCVAYLYNTGVTADIVAILADTNELQTDWKDGGRLDLIQDIIAADTTTDIPALIGTAQADLDIITGATGVNLLAATQTSIDAILTDTAYLEKIVKNKKILSKTGSVWSLIIYDDDGTTPILEKVLNDKNDADIKDIADKILAKELASSV